MPLDATHQHSSADIMRADATNTPIDPSGGSGIPQGGPATLPLDMDGNQIKNLGDGTAPGDAVRKSYVDARRGASVAPIADPSAATAEEVANKVNELISSLLAAHLLSD